MGGFLCTSLELRLALCGGGFGVSLDVKFDPQKECAIISLHYDEKGSDRCWCPRHPFHLRMRHH